MVWNLFSYMKYSGDTFVISCPYCGQPAHYSGLASSNSFGGKAWTDGYCFYPMSNNCSSYTRCFACKDVYSIRDAKRIGMMSITDFVDDSLDIPDEVWSKSRPIAEPSDEDMYNSLNKGLLKNEKEARIIAWWKSNDKFRFASDSSNIDELLNEEERIQNMNILMNLLEKDNSYQSLMYAEILRQRSNFETSLSILNDISPTSDSEKIVKKMLIDLCASKKALLTQI